MNEVSYRCWLSGTPVLCLRPQLCLACSGSSPPVAAVVPATSGLVREPCWCCVCAHCCPGSLLLPADSKASLAGHLSKCCHGSCHCGLAYPVVLLGWDLQVCKLSVEALLVDGAKVSYGKCGEGEGDGRVV
eukprot:2458283-Rhodomonas_salina.1